MGWVELQWVTREHSAAGDGAGADIWVYVNRPLQLILRGVGPVSETPQITVLKPVGSFFSLS